MSALAALSSVGVTRIANDVLTRGNSSGARLFTPAGGDSGGSAQSSLATQDVQSLLAARSQAQAVKLALQNLKPKATTADAGQDAQVLAGKAIYKDQAVMLDQTLTGTASLDGSTNLSGMTQLESAGISDNADFELQLADGTSATISFKVGPKDEIRVDGTKFKIEAGDTVTSVMLEALNSISGITASANANGTLHIESGGQSITLTDGSRSPLADLGITAGTYAPPVTYQSTQIGTDRVQVGSEQIVTDEQSSASTATNKGYSLTQVEQATAPRVSRLLRGGSQNLQGLRSTVQGVDLTVAGLHLRDLDSVNDKRASQLIDQAIAKVDTLIARLEKTASRAVSVAVTAMKQGPQTEKSLRAIQDAEKMAQQLANGTYSQAKPGVLVSRTA